MPQQMKPAPAAAATIAGQPTACVRLHAPDLSPAERSAVARRWSGPRLRVAMDREDDEGASGNLLVVRRLAGPAFDLAKRLADGPRPCVAIVLGDGHATADLLRLRRLGLADVLSDAAGDAPAATLAARFERLAQIEAFLASPEVEHNLIGDAPAWRRTLRKVIELAAFSGASILLTGPTGTGKELLARLIHLLDARANKRNLVVLDCTTVVPELSGSEFFGHERGAFTNAMCSREGAFAMADGGTLFLDEIGELPPALQAELLRVVQDRTYKRVGGNQWQKASFRLVCATNRDLAAEQRAGRFRTDLYYRLVTHVVHVPALHERRADVPALAEHFLGRCDPPVAPAAFDAPVLELLTRRDYPGNVRELRQLVTAMASRHVGPGPITLGDVPEDELADAPATPAELSAAPAELPATTAELSATAEPFPSVQDQPAGGAPASMPDLLAALSGAAPPGADAPADLERDPLMRSAIRAAVAGGHPLQTIKRVVGALAVEEAIQSARGNVRLAARKLGVTDRALQLRGCSSRAPESYRMPGVKSAS